jgi:hypothetical protein
MAAFCRFWRMTPRDIDALSDAEFAALARYMTAELKARERAARKAGRRRS